uniref:F-box protein CPR1-like n=1 Tax=Erigeron canadensis TaxID=72917 RepID=UPI001CB8E3C7|nr:F-box protein CPR1-like [Erigeron canadensis]
MDVCYIPLELQIEIIKRLPIKTLIRFRLVSKPWKSIIESSDFIADYNIHTHHYNHQQLLVSLYDTDYAYTFDDDNSFPQHKSCLIPSLLNDKPFTYKMIGSSQGLFAIYRYHEHNKRDVVIWNPSIRKCVEIPIPNVLQTVVGFGVCNTTDPIILKIDFISIPWQVELFKLSTRKWRRLSNTCFLSGKSFHFHQKAVVTERFIYWIGFYNTRFVFKKLILSFDMINEKFAEISLPPSLRDASLQNLNLSKLRESLVLLETIHTRKRTEYEVWMMMEEDGVRNMFKKLYTVKAPDASIERVLGFRKNGQPIIQLQNPFKHELLVYEPDSELFNRIGIDGYGYQCFAGSYMGTLHLLDQ